MVQEEIDNHHLQGLNVVYGADVSEFLDTELHDLQMSLQGEDKQKENKQGHSEVDEYEH